jgi:hypothetical protein
MIRYDVDQWNEFFHVANAAKDLRTPPDVMNTPPKRKFTLQ